MKSFKSLLAEQRRFDTNDAFVMFRDLREKAEKLKLFDHPKDGKRLKYLRKMIALQIQMDSHFNTVSKNLVDYLEEFKAIISKLN